MSDIQFARGLSILAAILFVCLFWSFTVDNVLDFIVEMEKIECLEELEQRNQ